MMRHKVEYLLVAILKGHWSYLNTLLNIHILFYCEVTKKYPVNDMERTSKISNAKHKNIIVLALICMVIVIIIAIAIVKLEK